jgi:hypothetical protein
VDDGPVMGEYTRMNTCTTKAQHGHTVPSKGTVLYRSSTVCSIHGRPSGLTVPFQAVNCTAQYCSSAHVDPRCLYHTTFTPIAVCTSITVPPSCIRYFSHALLEVVTVTSAQFSIVSLVPCPQSGLFLIQSQCIATVPNRPRGIARAATVPGRGKRRREIFHAGQGTM